MGRAHTPCCSYVGLSRGPWTPEEDLRLIKYIETHGEGNWRTLPRKAGLQRCGKGCRLRWMNYLRPNVKRGHISPDEEEMIVRLHKLLGNRWSLIAGRIPGRTDNEVKNYWNTHLRKKVNATKGFLRNSQSLCKQPSSLVEICEGGTGTLNINEMESSFAPCKAARDITRHAAKDQNKGSSCSHIGEIVSLLGEVEEFYDRSTYVARDAESIENWKQLSVGFHDPAINMDLSYSTVNHIDSASPHGNHHQSSSMPSIYSPEFKPMAWPSDYGIPGLYHSISESVTSMQGHEFRLQVDNFGSGNYMNSKEKPTGDGSNNLQSKTTVEPEIHIPPLGFSTDHEFPIDCDGFHDFRDMVLPEFELEQNGILSSCMQPEDGITGLCSEPWLSSLAGWFDCIEQL